MKINTILEMIASNREFLLQNSGIALDNLQALHRNFDSETDDACIMSLALNDSIASTRFYSDYEKAIAISQEILNRFPESDQYHFIAYHLKTIGRNLAFTNQFEAAINTMLHALEICESKLPKSSSNVRLTVDVLHDLAMVSEKAKSDSELSIKYLEQALTLLEGTSFEVHKGMCLMGLGILKHNMGETQEALKYHLSAEQKFEDNYNYINLSAVHNNLALCYHAMGQNEEAETYLQRALDLRMTLGNKDEIAECYYNLGCFYEMTSRIEDAHAAMISSRDYGTDHTNERIHKMVLDWLTKYADAHDDAASAEMYRTEKFSMAK